MRQEELLVRENDKERTYYLSTSFHRHPPLEKYSSGTLILPVKETSEEAPAFEMELSIFT